MSCSTSQANPLAPSNGSRGRARSDLEVMRSQLRPLGRGLDHISLTRQLVEQGIESGHYVLGRPGHMVRLGHTRRVFVRTEVAAAMAEIQLDASQRT